MRPCIHQRVISMKSDPFRVCGTGFFLSFSMLSNGNGTETLHMNRSHTVLIGRRPAWIFRRTFVVLLSVTAPLCSQAEGQSANRPNVILMMADDLGFSDLGCYGSEISTPNLDQLAADGVRLSQFYNTAKCHSSRICLLTGRYPFQAGGEAMSAGPTIAEVMKENGYFTSMTGKWHLQDQPTDRGFDRYWGHLSGATNYFTGDNTFRLNGQPWNEFGPEFYTTDANIDFATRFITEAVSSGKPFFHYIAFNAPHYPLQAKEVDIKRYKGKYSEGWDSIRQRRYQRQLDLKLIRPEFALSPRPDYIPAWHELTDKERAWEEARMEVFAAMVDCLDQNVGRLTNFLKQQNLFENTLLLFCSDNGACPFERTKGRSLPASSPESYWCYDVGWAHVGNTPFRWFKQNQHEGGISSPLIAHWPAVLKNQADTISHQPGHLIDLVSTICDATNSTFPESFRNEPCTRPQGQTLLPVLKGQERTAPEFLYFQFSNNRAIRVNDWKAVSANGGRWELYDMTNDRSELSDLAGSNPDKLSELIKKWHDVAENVDMAPRNLRKPASDKAPTFPEKSRTRRTARPGGVQGVEN